MREPSGIIFDKRLTLSFGNYYFQSNLAYSSMEEQDQLLQKVLAANDTDAVAEGERGDDPKSALSMKVIY